MRCKDCEYVKCYAVNKKMYYCENKNLYELAKTGYNSYGTLKCNGRKDTYVDGY